MENSEDGTYTNKTEGFFVCFVLLQIQLILRTHMFLVCKKTSSNCLRMVENVKIKFHGHFKKQ